jgi:serine phosphatase RsbU (regulator of sigma subunit)
VPLAGGLLGVVVGNVAGRGVEVAPTMGDLRAAARAYVALDGTSPARVVEHLDRLASTTGLGKDARLGYLTVRPETGEVRVAGAGSPPALIVEGRRGRYVEFGSGALVGANAARTEVSFDLATDEVLLLCTDGLLQHRKLSRDAGLERLKRAAMAGPPHLDELLDHVLAVCTADRRRDDDICLVGLRLPRR